MQKKTHMMSGAEDLSSSTKIDRLLPFVIILGLVILGGSAVNEPDDPNLLID
jgi:hypothetical protein